MDGGARTPEAPPVDAQLRAARWTLRIGVAAEFAGHGWLALGRKDAWVPFVTLWGFDRDQAEILMSLVGGLDLLLALHVLVRPIPLALGWMAFWAAFTACLRPLSGEAFVELVERGANIGAPLALLWLTWWPSRWSRLDRGQ